MKMNKPNIKSLFTFRSKDRYATQRRKSKPDRRILRNPEELEMRLMPAVFIVTNTNDNGAGSFRQAILDSNANTIDATDTILFDSSLSGQTITMESLVTVNDTASKDLVINGLGASNLTLSGGNSTGLLQFSTSTTLTDFRLGSDTSDNVILFGTNSLSLANIVLTGSLTASGCATTSCINVSGPITATGTGVISLTGRNAYITSGVSTQSGSITVTADNGEFQSSTSPGIFLSGSAACLTTSGGSISLMGRGGSGDSSQLNGVCISQGTLYAGGTGNITIQGVGSNASSSFEVGVCITSGTLATANGAINIMGSSCGSGGNDYGVNIDNTDIFASGTGCLSISGTSGNGSYIEKGALVGSSYLRTAGGCISLSGTSFGTGIRDIGFHYFNSSIEVQAGMGGISLSGVSGASPTSADDEAGLYMYNNYGGYRISTANGPIVLNGRALGANSNNTGVVMYSTVLINAGGTAGINIMAQSANASALAFTLDGGQMTTNGGNITISANSVSLNPNNAKINPTTSGIVRFQTLGAGIDLGGADSTSNLGLSVAELGTITAGTLSIGSSTGSVATPNSGFENPQVLTGSYQYTPVNANWTFKGQSGIAANGSVFGGPAPIQGNQVGIVQMKGVIQQTISGFKDEALYTLSYYSSGRPGYGGNPLYFTRPLMTLFQTFES